MNGSKAWRRGVVLLAGLVLLAALPLKSLGQISCAPPPPPPPKRISGGEGFPPLPLPR